MTSQTSVRTRSTWKLDPAHTLVEFAAKHMMITTVKGRFVEIDGTIQVDESDPTRSSVEVTIAAASIDTRNEGRDAHLRSADFLDVEKHPTLIFRSTKVEAAGEDSYRVTGDLTIRGVTRPAVLDMAFEGQQKDPWGGSRAAFSATTKIDRRDFGLTWNVVLESGGALVSNDVKISIEAQAIKQS